MYGIGQRVVHPMHGAGVIENVTEELLYGAARTYYVFRQAVSGLVLKLPTDNCEAIGVRLCTIGREWTRCSRPSHR